MLALLKHFNLSQVMCSHNMRFVVSVDLHSIRLVGTVLLKRFNSLWCHLSGLALNRYGLLGMREERLDGIFPCCCGDPCCMGMKLACVGGTLQYSVLKVPC